jgi:hypothetical protein
MQDMVDALKTSLLEAADKAGVGQELKSAIHEEQQLEKIALWFRKAANRLKATKPGILSFEMLGSAGVVVAIAYYVIKIDPWIALLIGFLIIALRLCLPWIVNRIAAHRELGLRQLRKIV